MQLGDVMLDKVQTLLLRQRAVEVPGPAQQPRLALLANAPLEDRFDEDLPVALDEIHDFRLARRWTQDLGRRKPCKLQQWRPVQHSGDLHSPPTSPLG